MIRLDVNLNPTNDIITLSSSLPMQSGSGVYSGFSEGILYYNGNYHVMNFIDGDVETIAGPEPTAHVCENWILCGIAERIDGIRYITDAACWYSLYVGQNDGDMFGAWITRGGSWNHVPGGCTSDQCPSRDGDRDHSQLNRIAFLVVTVTRDVERTVMTSETDSALETIEQQITHQGLVTTPIGGTEPPISLMTAWGQTLDVVITVRPAPDGVIFGFGDHVLTSLGLITRDESKFIKREVALRRESVTRSSTRESFTSRLVRAVPPHSLASGR